MRFRVTKIPLSSITASSSSWIWTFKLEYLCVALPSSYVFQGPLALGFFFFYVLGGRASGSTTGMSSVAIGD
ncbi:hypothetical protein TSUD_286210 [Trifolium subterraneum]|uniref:Uncharacterized protein n=1 Tax=Trifolium subterraneum TaxID=3900 RepID=A0A2Z6P4I7_TRISU|nr:hypothetical protein TSUD_286210 [Trifolium subterraneum]